MRNFYVRSALDIGKAAVTRGFTDASRCLTYPMPETPEAYGRHSRLYAGPRPQPEHADLAAPAGYPRFRQFGTARASNTAASAA